MNKIIISFFLLPFLTISACAQDWGITKEIEGNGQVNTQVRNLEDYHTVSLEGSMDVKLIRGTEGEVSVQAEENFLEYVLTEVKEGKLEISVKNGYQLDPSSGHNVLITVPVADLEEVALTGSGDIHSDTEIESENFEVNLTGSGSVKIPLRAVNTRARLTGSGDIVLNGTATNFDCSLTGSGNINAFELKSENVDATLTGSGDIEVYASEGLKARLPGSGDISYRGNPAKEDFSTLGAGTIEED